MNKEKQKEFVIDVSKSMSEKGRQKWVVRAVQHRLKTGELKSDAKEH